MLAGSLSAGQSCSLSSRGLASSRRGSSCCGTCAIARRCRVTSCSMKIRPIRLFPQKSQEEAIGGLASVLGRVEVGESVNYFSHASCQEDAAAQPLSLLSLLLLSLSSQNLSTSAIMSDQQGKGR